MSSQAIVDQELSRSDVDREGKLRGFSNLGLNIMIGMERRRRTNPPQIHQSSGPNFIRAR